MSAEAARVLRTAADLIEPEGAWTTETFARDIGGVPVHSLSDKAVCWCADGALRRAARYGDTTPAWLHLYRQVQPWAGVAIWNDAPERTQAEVVTALRAAADEAERS